MRSSINSSWQYSLWSRAVARLRNPRFKVSQSVLVVVCVCLVGLVGYVDYLTG